MKINPIIYLSILLSTSCFAYDLGSNMTDQEKQETGYNSLTKQQQRAWNLWISQNLTPLKGTTQAENLSLSVNSQGGRVLILSDGSKWEVDPDDVHISSIWLTPFPLEIAPSHSEKYPNILINLTSKEQVHVKQIS
jgi:hypothetical protein